MNLKDKYILGISCGFHDASACLVLNGKVINAAEEERFTGIKHDSSFPSNTIKWLLKNNNLKKEDISYVTFYEDPNLKIDRVKHYSKSFLFYNEKLRNIKSFYNSINDYIKKSTYDNVNIIYGNHHQSHLSYGYHTSPFKESAIISIDGVGEWETTSYAIGKQKNIQKIKSIDYPHSLGMLYSAFTAFLGFKPNEGEYKVMGLAPYGNPNKYSKLFQSIYSLTKDGGFKINMDYFTYDWDDKSMFNEKLGMLFGLPNRLPDEELTQKHKDIAATLQYHYEIIFFHMLEYLYKSTQSENLCVVGGCAYNGTANGKILQKTKFKNVWIPPAPSDAGSSIGSALDFYYKHTTSNRRVKNTNPFLGNTYTKNDIISDLVKFKNIQYEYKSDSKLIPHISQQITEGKVVGWFDGAMEFGARALGNRSILANPRDPQMKDKVNSVVKKRESFRPFAPMVLSDEQIKYFEYEHDVPYMNQVVKVKAEHQKDLPAITHVDGSARIQTVDKDNKRIYKLLQQLEIDNKYPIVLNTSFNLKDQTMVRDPKTAIETFLNCDMDILVLGNYIVHKI